MRDSSQFFELKNQSGRDEIYITGEIGWDFEVEALLSYMAQFRGKDIDAHIFSGGGDLFSALAYYDFVLQNDIRVTSYGYGLVGSAATVFMAASGANRSYLGANAFYFIHGAISENEDLKSKGDKRLVEIYHSLTGLNRNTIKAMLRRGDKGEFMLADEAKDHGFVSHTFEAERLAADSTELINKYKESLTNFQTMSDQTPEENKDLTWKDGLLNFLNVKTDAVTEKENGDLKAQVTDLEAQNKELEEKVSAHTQEVEKNNEALTQANERIEASQKETEELKTSIGEYQGRITELEAELEEAKAGVIGDPPSNHHEGGKQVPGADPEPKPKLNEANAWLKGEVDNNAEMLKFKQKAEA